MCSHTLASIRALTEVQHRWDKTPSDDKLATLEQLLQPLFGLFAHFCHLFIRFYPEQRGRDSAAAAKDTKEEVTRRKLAVN